MKNSWFLMLATQEMQPDNGDTVDSNLDDTNADAFDNGVKVEDVFDVDVILETKQMDIMVVMIVIMKRMITMLAMLTMIIVIMITKMWIVMFKILMIIEILMMIMLIMVLQIVSMLTLCLQE